MINLIRFVFFMIWISGVVIAKGFWSTFFAIFFAPWSWYLVAERLLTVYGIV